MVDGRHFNKRELIAIGDVHIIFIALTKAIASERKNVLISHCALLKLPDDQLAHWPIWFGEPASG